MFARLTLLAAALALLLMLGAGPGFRLELVTLGAAFKMMKWGTYIGLGAAACALLQLVIPRARRNAATWLVLAVALGAAAAAPPIYMLHLAKSLPDIHDVTTDTADAPRFETLLRAREASPNKADYNGKAAVEQKRGYPDIAPLQVAAAPQQAFALALEAARAEGWQIASSDAAKGSIEATATSLWFGFKDDIVVRVRPAEGGSRIDMRSASRVGESDLGANAKRVRAYLARLR